MANTRYLTTDVEDYVRSQLAAKFGVSFHKKMLPLAPGGQHEFDAVSVDGEIVASIKATSGLTSGGKLPQGKFNSAIAEIYYLTLVSARKRALILTNSPFRGLLLKRLNGALSSEISVDAIPLPLSMQAEVDRVLGVASKEVSPQVRVAAAEAEADPT